MIGSLLAARFVAKKPWMQSIIFWAIVFFIGLLMVFVLDVGWILSFIIGIIVFLGVAWYYLKVMPFWLGIIMYIVSVVINYAISYLLSAGGIFFQFI